MTIKPGALRFNTDSMKLEIFRGSANYEGSTSMAGIGTLAAGQWEEIQATSPEIQTGGTRGLRMGGNSMSDVIEYYNVESTGDTIDFGDLSEPRRAGSSVASRTRAVIAGGEEAPAGIVNTIEFVTIASTGDAVDFGDMDHDGQTNGVVSNPAAFSNGHGGL